MDILNNGNELFKEYSDEARNRVIDLEHKPAKDVYMYMEQNGGLYCLGAYEDDKLVGFLTLIVTTLPHYNVNGATVESIFVSKPYRKSKAWVELLTEAKRIALGLSCKGLFLIAGVDSRLEKIANRSGFLPTNTAYTMPL